MAVTIGNGSNGYPVDQIERDNRAKIQALQEANNELLEALELIVSKYQTQDNLVAAITVARSYLYKYGRLT